MGGTSSLAGALTSVSDPSCHIKVNSYRDVFVIILDPLSGSLHFGIPYLCRLQ